MVTIRYMSTLGDETKTVTVKEAQKILGQELEHGNIVYDEDEKRIVDKATLGALGQDANVGVFPAIKGG